MATTKRPPLSGLRITAEDLRSILATGEPCTFLDTRSPDAWNASREKLPGALRVEPGEFRPDPHWRRDQLIVAYCTCPHDEASVSLAQELRTAGYTDVFALAGGFDAWKRAGGEVEPR
jgi:rhodanese-related sulfurtransferase